MAIEGTSASSAGASELGIRSLQLARGQQEQQGQQTLQLLESASDVPQASSSSNPAVGSNVNTFA